MPELNATFNGKSNGAFNNALFSAGKIPDMPKSLPAHPSIERLQEAARSVKPPVVGHTAIAAWLAVSPQLVTNWARRGVSRAGALAAQTLSGYSANWLLTGQGEPLSRPADARKGSTAPPPTGAKKGDFIKALTPEDEELISHFQHLFPSDKEEAIKKMAELAAIRKRDLEKLLAENRLPEIMEKAANAAKSKATASTSVDPNDPALKQNRLPGVE